jgi:hypothetical protein
MRAWSDPPGACSGTYGLSDRLAAHLRGKQPLALEAADLDVPARPLAVCLDAQFKGDEFGKLEGFFRIRKLANPKMTFGAQRAREREAISMHGKLVPGYPRGFLAKRLRRSPNPLLKNLEGFATEKSPCGRAHPCIQGHSSVTMRESDPSH